MRRQQFRWIKYSFLVLSVLSLLNACSLQGARYPGASSSAAASSFAPLLLAILLFLGAVTLAYTFYTRGDLKKWIDEGLQTGRSKLDQTKFKGQKRRTEAEQISLLKTLGKQAWDARVSDPSYAEEYKQIEELDAQAEPVAEVVKAIQLELAKTRDSRNKLTASYEGHVGELKTQLEQMNESIKRLKSEQNDATESLKKAEDKRRSLENEVRSYESKVANLQTSDAPDRDTQIASLNNSIATLGKTIYALGDQIGGLNGQTQKLASEQSPYLIQIDNLNSQINQAGNEYKDLLLPLDQKVSNLEENLKTRQAELAAVREKMNPLIESLGPRVDAARPESPALLETYQKLDIKKEQLISASEGYDLANTRLVASNKEHLRNFYLMIGALILVVALIGVLLVMAF